MKTNIYIDGYNLFYGCLKHSDDKWLDLCQLFTTIIKQQNPQAEISIIYFFTANIKSKIATHGQQAQQAQNTYHRALEQTYPSKIKIIKGYYSLEKANLLAYQKPPDKNNRLAVWKLEEKQTDVNIALTAYRDAIQQKVEQVVFVSNDTDLEPALIALREDLKDTINIGIIIPVRKHSKRPVNARLSNHANWTRSYILDEELKNSHLPNKISTNKKAIIKPKYW
ncbi:MAG: NYN domain-containing protein [Moraxellaceae bacterium]|nr:NYN domain-containing protein [Moraxellaceae bacterium]